MIRTSTTDPIRADWLPGRRVGLTFAPGKSGPSWHTGGVWQRDLDADLAELRAQGVDVLVCLLDDHELGELRIERLPEAADAAGLRMLRLPIEDAGVPRLVLELAALLSQVRAEVAAGARVVIHCAGGLGRTGLVAGCYLVQGGMGAEAALRVLRRARGPRCPETLEQVEYVRRWAAGARRAA